MTEKIRNIMKENVGEEREEAVGKGANDREKSQESSN